MNNEIKNIGAQLANCAYNLAQDEKIPKQWRDTLDRLRKEWDAALAAPSVASGAQETLDTNPVGVPRVVQLESCVRGLSGELEMIFKALGFPEGTVIDAYAMIDKIGEMSAAIAAQAKPMAITDEQLGAIYKLAFESMPGCARAAPKPFPLVIEYGRAVAQAAVAGVSQ